MYFHVVNLQLLTIQRNFDESFLRIKILHVSVQRVVVFDAGYGFDRQTLLDLNHQFLITPIIIEPVFGLLVVLVVLKVRILF